MIPTISEITKPLLGLVESYHTVTTNTLEIDLSEHFKLTNSEREQQKKSGNERLFLHRLRWSVTYLKKAELIKAIGRGEVAILSKGRQLLENPNCPEKITESYLNRYKSFKETRRRI